MIELSVVSRTVIAMMCTLLSFRSDVRSWRRPTRFSANTENCFTGSCGVVLVCAAMARPNHVHGGIRVNGAVLRFADGMHSFAAAMDSHLPAHHAATVDRALKGARLI